MVAINCARALPVTGLALRVAPAAAQWTPLRAPSDRSMRSHTRYSWIVCSAGPAIRDNGAMHSAGRPSRGRSRSLSSGARRSTSTSTSTKCTSAQTIRGLDGRALGALYFPGTRKEEIINYTPNLESNRQQNTGAKLGEARSAKLSFGPLCWALLRGHHQTADKSSPPPHTHWRSQAPVEWYHLAYRESKVTRRSDLG